MNEEKFREWNLVVPTQKGKMLDSKRIDKFVEQLKNILPEKLNFFEKTSKYKNFFLEENIQELRNISKKFSKQTNGVIYKWDYEYNGHNFGSSAVSRYIEFLKYRLVIKQMELYDNNPDNFELNNATIFFQIKNNPNKYPVKALLKPIYQELDLPEDYRTNGAKSKLEQIFKYFDIKFIDNKGKNRMVINIQNIILYGAPGIGKTYNYKNLISMIENQEKSQKEIFDTIANNSEILENNIEIPKERVAFITFHQSYSYEDFIEGFRPQKDGTIQLKDGVFKEFCDIARKDKEQNYYFVIDEINRGNISKIFGELITLIEEDKREELSVILPYSKQTFSIPKNLYIIATMNSTDKSIATIDIALRRRFTFIKMKPNPDLVSDVNAKDFMIQLNEVIKERLGEDYMIGHSYFMGVETQEDLEFVKEYKIKPLLEEYFYASGESVEKILDEVQKQ